MPDRKAKRFKAAHKIRVSFVGAAARLSGELVDLSNSGLLVRCSDTPELETLGRLGIELGRETIRLTPDKRPFVKVGGGEEVSLRKIPIAPTSVNRTGDTHSFAARTPSSWFRSDRRPP